MLDTGKLPNLRRLIVPDEGHILIDMDLERADLYAVAWDSGCKLLQQRLRTEDVHTRHAIDFLGKKGKYERDLMKKLAHAADYLVGVNTASVQTGLPVSKIREFLLYWFTTYPEIGTADKAHPNPSCWHERVKRAMYDKRMVTNAFGYRLPFYDRLDRCLPEAVAWIAQSSVAIVINKALYNIAINLPEVQLLLQVHDSLTMQVVRGEEHRLIPLIRQQSLITVPYTEPLIIPVSFKVSEVSWGDVRDYVPPLQT